MRVSDYIVEYLYDLGITSAFVITGRGALFLNDALARKKEILKIFPHHEQSASFAACAAAALTGQLQVVFVSTGCASTNVITGVLSAWQDHIPMIVISGQNSLEETTEYRQVNLKTFGQQEANIIPIVKSITKYSCMIKDAKSIKYHLDKAVHEAHDANPGPVWIDVPLDIQNSHIDPAELRGFQSNSSIAFSNYAASEQLTESLRTSKRPVFLIGSGVRASGAGELIKRLSTENGIPLVYTHSAVDVVPLTYENCIGSIGSQGASRAGAFAVQNSDLLIVLGSRMNSLTTGPDRGKFARAADIYAVDIDSIPHETNGINYTEIINADITDFLVEIEPIIKKKCEFDTSWLKFCHDLKIRYKVPEEFNSTPEALDLYDLAQSVPDLMPPNGVFVCDSGFIDVIIPTNAPFQPNQRCIRPVSQGAMGFALPAAIGLASVSDLEVYCCIGDGSIMFNLQELETLSRYSLNVKILVINNDMYSVIKRRQKKLFRDRIIGVDASTGLKTPDFQKIANAFDIEYFNCSPGNYAALIEKETKRNGPQIFELPGKSDQEYIEINHARTAQRRFVTRPIEDQKPFLNREEFLKNMIIKPIDQ